MENRTKNNETVRTSALARYDGDLPQKYKLGDRSLPPEVAYQICKDEMALDANPLLNLASFVTTYMDDYADKLIAENVNKNFVDHEEYPHLKEIEDRCVGILADLFNAPDLEDAVGVATIGSSEGVMLAGLTLKRLWEKTRRKAVTDKPNIVMGANVQVVWEKFAGFFDVTPRYVPVTHKRYILNAEEAMKHVDENTIAVVGILGSTYTGQYEPIADICKALDAYQAKTGINIPVHVDAASGGFVAPFTKPDLVWDFRLPRVHSINTSGHKYGLVYPGVGWVLWRSRQFLPEDLVYHLNYLGNNQISFTLNFSRGGSHILAQYYNFLRLGKEGYRRVMTYLEELSDYFQQALEETKRYRFLSAKGCVPLVAWQIIDESAYTAFDVAEKLSQKGWVVPAYTLPENAKDVNMLRVVFREGFNKDLVDQLLKDIEEAHRTLEAEAGAKKVTPHDKNKKRVC